MRISEHHVSTQGQEYPITDESSLVVSKGPAHSLLQSRTLKPLRKWLKLGPEYSQRSSSKTVSIGVSHTSCGSRRQGSSIRRRDEKELGPRAVLCIPSLQPGHFWDPSFSGLCWKLAHPPSSFGPHPNRLVSQDFGNSHTCVSDCEDWLPR